VGRWRSREFRIQTRHPETPPSKPTKLRQERHGIVKPRVRDKLVLDGAVAMNMPLLTELAEFTRQRWL
jgi:hypothetical protein